MSLKIHSLIEGVATLGSGKELRASDGYRYTVMRDGLRMERTQFAQLKVGDLVLCWESGDNGKAGTKGGKAT